MVKKTLKKQTTNEKVEKKVRSINEVDMADIKSKIKEEYLVTYEMAKENNPNGLYEQRYKEYLTEEFNVKCVFLIASLIDLSDKLPSHLKKSQSLFKELLNIIRELMMNEFEISLYTMYIDDIGWEKNDCKTNLHLLCIGILTKVIISLFILLLNSVLLINQSNYSSITSSNKIRTSLICF